VPCVATDCGDAAELLGDTGLIVPRRDPAALAAAWEQFARVPAEERHSLGRLARRRIAANFDLNAIVHRYEAVYSEVAGAHRRQL
jgi:glycosyltransferase involved in cell wall biosynthesis